MPRCLLVGALAVLALAPAGAARAQTVTDPSLIVEHVVGPGLSAPTTMAFLAPDDFLVLLKAGSVRRVLNGVLLPNPVLTVPAQNFNERGLLGIAIDSSSPPRVFLYFTEADAGGTPLANRVYRYDWNPASGTLVNAVLVLDLPLLPGPNHDGGALVLGPPGEAPGVGDGSLLYAVIGDLNRNGQMQNNAAGAAPDDSGVILRVRGDGTPAPGNPFTPYCSVTTTTTCDDDGDCPGGEVCRTQVARYYAYGVRNSFGLALDPVTGSLWDTENGPLDYDEVNRIAPGTNSGWNDLMGPDTRDPQGVANLFNMPGAGLTYSDPEFSWLSTIAPTGIVLPHGSALGPAYDDKVLVGDANFGRIHVLPLDATRTALAVSGTPGLEDLVADNATEVSASVLGTGFSSITDLELGPDGAVYVVTHFPPNVYRVRGVAVVPALPGWAVAALVLLLATAGVLYARARDARPSR